jgi:hypothetical protein
MASADPRHVPDFPLAGERADTPGGVLSAGEQKMLGMCRTLGYVKIVSGGTPVALNAAANVRREWLEVGRSPRLRRQRGQKASNIK